MSRLHLFVFGSLLAISSSAYAGKDDPKPKYTRTKNE